MALIHESPFRVTELIRCIGEELPEARLSLSCDLTKMYEKTLRGSPEEVLKALEENPKTEKGEYCLVMDLHEVRRAAPEEEEGSPEGISLEARLTEEMLRQGLSLRDAQNELILRGEKKNAVKQAALNLKRMFA